MDGNRRTAAADTNSIETAVGESAEQRHQNQGMMPPYQLPGIMQRATSRAGGTIILLEGIIYTYVDTGDHEK